MNRYKLPLIAILIPLIIGILIGKQLDAVSWIDSITILLICFSLISVVSLSISLRNPQFKTLSSVFATITIFIFGIYRMLSVNAWVDNDYFGHGSTAEYFIGTINDLPKLGKSLKVTLDIDYVGKNPDNLRQANGQLLTYIKGITDADSLKPGDVLMLKGKLRNIAANANPRVFDYRDYLHNRNIFFQTFTDSSECIKLSSNNLPVHLQLAAKARAYCLGVLSTYITDTNSLAVASAMILGIRNLITDELYDAYTDTGAVHVLAVSGLHVGIVTSLLLWIFDRFKRKTQTLRIIELAVCLGGIWAFVLLTGGAPAVTRAATMFTLFFIGKFLARDGNIYNILALSATLMLTYSPAMLFQASFQFSFLALWSIVYFMTPLSNLFATSYPWLNKVITLINVAVSAQVLVFPLTIYFFHKFANYFWLSGLFVVAGAFVTLSLGLVMIGLQFFGLAILNESIVSPILNGILRLTNGIISAIQSIPGSSSDGLWLDTWAVLLLYASIACLMAYVTYKRFWQLGTSLLILIVFLGGMLVRKADFRKKQTVYIYDVYKNNLIDIINGHHYESVKSDNLDPTNEHFIAGNNRAYHGAEQSIGYANRLGPYFSVSDKLFLQANHDSILQYRSDRPINYFVVQQNFKPDTTLLADRYDIENIVVDGSNWSNTKSYWKTFAERQNIPYVDTQDGAIAINF